MRVIRGLLGVVLGLLVAGYVSAAIAPTQEGVQALAPTGKLRVGLYLGGPTNIIRGTTAEETKGVGFDLGKELARRLGVPFEPVVYPNAGGVVSGMKSGEWDIAFLALNPERENIVTFTAPFLVIEHGYLVPAGSPISTIGQVDRAGTRIGVPQGGSVNAVLARTIKNATVVPAPSLADAPAMLASGKVDIFAANKANLFELSDKLRGARVLEGRIGIDEITIALPKGREAGMSYVRQFLEEAKTEGLIKSAVQRAGLRGAVDK